MGAVILALHVVIAIALVGLILVQQGKGADAGAQFGGGASASGTVFGSRGSGNFLTKTTAILATLFFVTSLSLSYLSGKVSAEKDKAVQVETVVEPMADDRPALPGGDNTSVLDPAKPEQSDKPALPE